MVAYFKLESQTNSCIVFLFFMSHVISSSLSSCVWFQGGTAGSAASCCLTLDRSYSEQSGPGAAKEAEKQAWLLTAKRYLAWLL